MKNTVSVTVLLTEEQHDFLVEYMYQHRSCNLSQTICLIIMEKQKAEVTARDVRVSEYAAQLRKERDETNENGR